MDFIYIMGSVLAVYVVMVLFAPALDYSDEGELLLWYNGVEESRCYFKIL